MARKKVVSKTRRGNNEGSISQRKDGRWVGTITTGYDENGKQKRKSVYGKTRLEVLDKLNKMTNRVMADNYDYTQKNTIGQMMRDWLLVFKKNLVSPRTFEVIMDNFTNHIETKVGGMKIDEVNNIVIQKVLNEMISEGYSLAVVRKVKFIFNQFFDYAVQNNITSFNPTKLTKVKSTERKIYDSENKYKAIPQEKREEFLKCLNEDKFFKPLCLCMMMAGLRTGEALALTWEDIDFKNKCIHIRRGITVVPKFDENGNVKERKTVIGDTKTTCSVRDVPMPDILVEALEDYKTERELQGDLNGKQLTKDNSLVFGNSEGEVRTYHGTKKMFEDFLKRHNLNKLGIHFHTLRHTYSNMLFEANQNPKVIQALLGHKSVKTTLTTYNSVDKSYFGQVTEVLNNQFKSQREKSVQELEDDELDEELERLLKEKQARRKRNKDFEM